MSCVAQLLGAEHECKSPPLFSSLAGLLEWNLLTVSRACDSEEVAGRQGSILMDGGPSSPGLVSPV